MKQFSKVPNINKRISRSMEALFEKASVQNPYSSNEESVKKHDQVLNTIMEHLEKYLYQNGKIKGLEFLEKIKMPDDSIAFGKVIKIPTIGKMLPWIDHLDIRVFPNEKDQDIDGFVNPKEVEIREDKSGLAKGNIAITIPYSLDTFKRYAKSTLRHELYHLYQMATWNTFKEKPIKDALKKYSCNQLIDELTNGGLTIKRNKETGLYIFNEDSEVDQRISFIIAMCAYYLNPLEMQAWLQDSYETMYKNYYLYKETQDEKFKKAIPETVNKLYRLVRSGIDTLKWAAGGISEEDIDGIKFYCDNIIKHNLGISLNSKNLIERCIEVFEKRAKIFRDKLHKVYALFLNEVKDMNKDLKEHHIVTIKSVDKNHMIEHKSLDLDSLFGINNKLYESFSLDLVRL